MLTVPSSQSPNDKDNTDDSKYDAPHITASRNKCPTEQC